MALVSDVFLDTSFLLAGLIDIGSNSAAAQRILAAVAESRLGPPKTAWHCCLEFYSVSTRLPEEFRLGPADALRLVQEEILARFQVHDLPEPVRQVFFRQAAADRVTGGRLYDYHIAEIARSSGAKVVLTENRRHFAGLLRHGLRVLTAAEFADEAGC